jgi:hypothetical protein
MPKTVDLKLFFCLPTVHVNLVVFGMFHLLTPRPRVSSNCDIFDKSPLQTNDQYVSQGAGLNSQQTQHIHRPFTAIHYKLAGNFSSGFLIFIKILPEIASCNFYDLNSE